jgi:long-chain acyl-CoA synthetase
MSAQPLDMRGLLSGSRLVVFGGTGFLGKVFWCMLLHHYPEVEHIWLVVRQRTRADGSIRQSSEERFWAEIAGSEALEPLRKQHGAKFDDFLRQKITPIPGDVTEPFAGVPREVRDELRGKLTALVNASGVVDFNPPLDYALNVNAFGMQNLVALARDLGDLQVVHTSTCYVAGDRTGQVDEVDPRRYPFPKADQLDTSLWDPSREIAECVDLVENVRHRSGDAFRRTAFLDEARANLHKRGEPARGSALEDELDKVQRNFESTRLVKDGTERAKFWGWHNIYTYTKSIGEQILCHSGLKFTIVRPAVIESALTFPQVGWNEGINTSAPLIYLALKAPVLYPAERDTVLDVIPVDQVAIGMILSLAELLEGTHKPVYQYGSSDTNPLHMPRLVELVGLYKRRHFKHKGGNPLVNFVQRHYEPTWASASSYIDYGPTFIANKAAEAGGWLKKLGGPLKPLSRPAARGLLGVSQQLKVTARITDQFLPFMATHNYRFSCANTRAAHARLSEADKSLLPWAPDSYDWYNYILDIHCPGIERIVVPQIDERIARPKKPLRSHDHLVAFLDELAERHDLVPALLRTHEDGFTAVSYRELRERARATAARLVSVGVGRGHTVALAGANHPDWVIAYFGVLYAGAVVVPMDPASNADQARHIDRAAGLKAALLDEEAREAFAEGLSCDVLDLHDAAAPGDASGLPEVALTGDTLASVLFTSGTTGAPKGVMLTHANFTSMVASLGRIFPLRESDRLLSVLPLHHTFEFSCGLLLPLSMGCRILYLDEITGDKLSKGLKDGRITAMVGVPALWQILERRIRGQVEERGGAVKLAVDFGLELNRMLGRSAGLDVGRLLFGSVHERLGGNIRLLISGGAALPRETHALFSGLGLHLAEGYGLTEAAPVLTAAVPRPGMKYGSVGKPVPGVEVRIGNPDDAGVGEVLARGPNVMKGYYQNDRATHEVLDEDGWLHTGDLGRLDHKGRLVIMGRAKDVVVTASGENIYLDDVENALGTLEYVKELSLVGIPHARGGERLAMLAVPDDEVEGLNRSTLHARAMESIRDAVAKLPAFQRPAVLHLVDADLPRTATRKVQRKQVREIVERIEAANNRGLTRGKGLSGPVADAIAAVAGVEPGAISPETRLADQLSFDSLMLVELASALESTPGHPDIEALSRCETVADVVALAGRESDERVESEQDVREKVHIPDALAGPMKDGLGYIQREIYGKGLRTRVIGRAFIPQNRQTIVVSNHCSHLDMGLVKYALGPYGRQLVALAAKDYFFEGNKWWVAYFEQLTNLQPIDRKSGFRASFEQAVDVVGRGNIVLLFPEGTRRQDGSVGEFKPLVGKLALETGVDILPMHLEGTFDALPKGAVVPRSRNVTVRIGAPITVADMQRLTGGMRSAEAARTVARVARDAVLHLQDGRVLDPSRMGVEEALAAPEEEEGIESVFASLPGRYDPQRVAKPVSWYFALGGKDGPRYTVQVDQEACKVRPGRPTGGAADCVVKTSEAIFTRIVREAYVPSPDEFISGAIKTNEIPLLIEFSRVFNLSEVSL